MNPIIIFIPTLGAGGAERVATLLANNWSKTEQVIVVTLFKAPAFYKLADKSDFLCLNLLPSDPNHLRFILLSMCCLFRFRKLVKKYRPEFVISFMNKYNLFCLIALFGSGTPVVVSERDSPYEDLPFIVKAGRKIFYPTAAGVHFQTRLQEYAFKKEMRLSNTQVIPNPVTRIIKHSEWQPQKIVVCIARLVPKKGLSHILKAFALAELSDWKLVICGDGPLRDELQELAHMLQIAKHVIFAGAVNDLYLIHKYCGIFAFPSLYEGFPNALAEAMVSGLPCISYNCDCGPSDLIENEISGILVPVSNINLLSKAIVRIAADHSLAKMLGLNASLKSAHLNEIDISNEYLRFCRKSSTR